MISAGINLVMTVIGFSVSTMFIVFVCSRLICARIQLNASRRSFGIASGSDINMLEWGLHYVEPLLVANFPVKKYSDAFFSSSKDAQCTVCLAEYREDDALRILPYCGHFFHASCIDIWLQQHSTCPVCRVSLRQYPEKKRLMQPMYSSVIRSHHGMTCIETNSYRCTSTSNGLSSRAHNSNRTETIKEAQFPSEGVGKVAGESTSILIDGGQIAKHSRNKHVESPSNP